MTPSSQHRTDVVSAVATLSAEPGLEVLFSRGIPDAEAWNREERE